LSRQARFLSSWAPKCALVCLLLAALACAGRAAPAGAVAPHKSKPQPTLKVGPNPARVHGLLWRVQGTAGVLHVLGSIPVVGKDWYPLDPQIEHAFKTSTRLVVEINVEEQEREAAAEGLVAAARYTEPDTLEKHVGEGTWVRLAEVLGSAAERNALKGFRPWFIALNMNLGQLDQLGALPEQSLEAHFLAQAHPKKISALNSVQDQVALFQSLDAALAERFLTSMLAELPKLGEELKMATERWRAGDADGVFDALSGSLRRNYPDVFARLWQTRSQSVARSLLRLMKQSGGMFVILDASLLIGENSALNELSVHGLTVQQL